MAVKRQINVVTATRKRRGRPGRVGNEIFDMVQSLVGDHKATRTGAFKRIAEKTGRNEGTVAANYYRVARQRGVKLQARRPRGTAAAAPGLRAVGRPAPGRVMNILRELIDLVRQQSSEIQRLQRENQRFHEVRRLLAR